MATNRVQKMNKGNAGRQVPRPENKYLKKLSNKYADWIQDMNDELAELKQAGSSKSAFERVCHNSNGKPFVFEEGNMRSLHFDERMMQSAMLIDAPNELVFGYTRSMMGFLLINDEPRHILMIGLGGGSLAKFCYKYLPHARITVVEINANVIALRDQFLIPSDDDRFQIVHMDAVEFIEQSTDQYDVILLDGFDADGLVATLLADDFISSCQTKLEPHGILVTNMWGKSKTLISVIARMSHIFNDPVWWCHSSDSYNLITFALKSDAHVFNNNLVEKARALDKSYWLGLENLAGRIRTISRTGLEWVLAPDCIQFNLKNFFFQEAVERKVAYFFAADAMIALTGRSWI